MAGIKNFIRGDTRDLAVTVVDSTGVPINITGGTVFFTVSASDSPADDTLALVSKTVTTHTAPTLGQTTVTLAAADTNSITPGTYYYDLQYKDSIGNITSTKAETIQIIGDISRRTT